MAQQYTPLHILWDYENCPRPSPKGARELTGTQIVSRLREQFAAYGAILSIKAFANSVTIPATLREELQTSAVAVVDAVSVEVQLLTNLR